ncbi:DUF4466 family protein [Telluribacter sp. SYSU D00476]|uniref:DUF4466 family protein n=1 Tax=Telluribacter sp. SYSU D00476 TaxID=2811430 RepID=UPI001FF34D8C|nr:DUF4466 family protein [Telluribacter sp. SYSU D00476]
MQRNFLKYTSLLLSLVLLMTACEEEKSIIPPARTELQNDVIKRTLGPNIVGLNLEFAYAMALAPERGKLVSAQVEASIPGAGGTYMENKTYYTNGSGQDVGTEVGTALPTEGKITKVNFTKDTSASTLRYYYVIPEAARGQEVTFNFSATSSTGETVTYKMGPYKIAKMDMKLDMAVTDAAASYISIADMAVYTAEEAATKADKIDLVYLYRSIPGIMFNHALVSPGANPEYMPDLTLPAGVNRSTKIKKEWNLRDQHLARLQFGVFIDDLDFEKINLTDMPNYALNMRAESGAWVETADGRYRAYVYINSVNNNGKSARISIKRYAL